MKPPTKYLAYKLGADSRKPEAERRLAPVRLSDKCKHGVRDTETNLPYCRKCDEESKNKSYPVSGYAVPRALFSCSNEYCREEVSYPADMLYWFDAEKRWVCEMCWDDLPAPTDDDGKLTRGITLAEYIIGHQLPVAALLHNDGTLD